MVKNLWDITKVHCGNNHDELIGMEIQPKGKDYIYKCPKCKNFVTVREFEKVINKISKMIYDAEMNDEVANFTNYKWTDKGVKVKIVNHDDNGFVITIKNRDDLIG